MSHAKEISSRHPGGVAIDAYVDLLNGPMPNSDKDYRRAIMLAVLIGRQIESDYIAIAEASARATEAAARAV